MAIDIPLRGDRIPDGYPSVIKVVKVTTGCDSAGVDVISSSQATYALANVPSGAHIVDIGWRVAEVFTNAVTLTLGDSADADGWAQASDISTDAMTHIKTASEAFLDGLNEWVITSNAADTTTASTTWQVPAYARPGTQMGKTLHGSDGSTARSLEVVVGGADPAVGKLEVYIYYHMAYGQKST
jgi:hypothetical protein